MSENNELFPFPTVPESGQSSRANKPDSDLPAFPGSESQEAPLDNGELREIRQFLASRRVQHENPKVPVPEHELPPMSIPTLTSVAVQAETVAKPERILQQQLTEYWDSLNLAEPFEIEAKKQLSEIIGTISNIPTLVRVWGAISSLLPIKTSLRHGTPDQKVFTLIILGERFLQLLAGIAFSERKRLLKIIARYLSEASENWSFIQMEGETFNPQYHERAPGSMPSGKTVREMHGFLVTARSSNQVVKIGLVLT